MQSFEKYPILLKFVFAGMLCSIFTPATSRAAACRRETLSGQEGRALLARQNYSPFTAMALTSFVGNLSATIAIAEGFDGSKDFKLETGAAIVLWSASGLLAFAEACTPNVDSSIDPGSVKPGEINYDRFASDRRMFLLMHTLNTIPTLAFALKSDHEQRWLLFSGAVLLPAVMDIILRNTFFRERVSPWTFSPAAFEQAGTYNPGMFVGYRW